MKKPSCVDEDSSPAEVRPEVQGPDPGPDRSAVCLCRVSDVHGPGPDFGGARMPPPPRARTHLHAQTGNEQQRPRHQVQDSGRPAAEQRVPELPARDHVRHRLVEEPEHREVGDVGDRDETHDPGHQAQHPRGRLQGPLAPQVVPLTRAAVDQVQPRDGQQQSEQPGPQGHAHQDPGQLDVGGQTQQAVVGSALQTPQVLHHAGLPQPQLVALGRQQLGGQGEPGGHEGGGQRADPGPRREQDPSSSKAQTLGSMAAWLRASGPGNPALYLAASRPVRRGRLPGHRASCGGCQHRGDSEETVHVKDGHPPPSPPLHQPGGGCLVARNNSIIEPLWQEVVQTDRTSVPSGSLSPRGFPALFHHVEGNEEAVRFEKSESSLACDDKFDTSSERVAPNPCDEECVCGVVSSRLR
ncbi:hypothetical protein INR49_022798 [Caranx melampygus]|nr:hypothetical protein INR49_022798 [Caranx melampygus]